MKKRLAYALITTLTLAALSGCSASNGTEESTEASTEASAEASTQTAPEDESGEDGEDETSDGLLELGDPVTDKAAYLSGINIADYIRLGDYKKLEIEVSAPTLDEEMLAEYMAAAESMAEEEVTDRPVEEGDTVNIDYAGVIKETGEAFDGGTAEGQTLTIGSGAFIDGFEDGLIGKKIGETVELNLKFPDPYQNNPDLAGVDVVFTVTINGITHPAEKLTDDNVGSLGIPDVSTVKELQEYFENALMEDAQSAYDQEVQAEMIAALKDASEFKGVPQAMVDRLLYSLKETINMYVSYGYYASAEEMLQAAMEAEEYTGDSASYLEEEATELAKSYLVIGAVAEAEKLEVEESEVDREAASMLEYYGYTSVSEYDEETGSDLKETIREGLLMEKVSEFLGKTVKVKEPEETPDD